MDDLIIAKHESDNKKRTLTEHVKDLLKVKDYICQYFGEKILDILSKNYKDIFFNLLEVVILFHDIGKCNRKFQDRIKNKYPKKEDEVDHNLLSPTFLEGFLKDNKDNDLLVQYKHLIYKAVAFHHKSYTGYLQEISSFHKIQKSIVEDVKPYLDGLHSFSNFIKSKNYSLNHLSLDYSFKNLLNERFDSIEEIKTYMMLKGLLHRFDHIASILIEKNNFIVTGKEHCLIISDEELEKSIKDFIKERQKIVAIEFKDFQINTRNHKDSNIITTAFAGSGKTVADHLWKGLKKFYLVPTRISAEAFYLDALKIYGDENVGILHGDAITYLSNKENIENFTSISISEDDFNLTRNLAKPYTIATADQLLTFIFKFPRYEKILASLIGAKITIDEVHLFDPYMFKVTIECLKILKEMGANFHLMTATLPSIYKNELEKSEIQFVDNPSSDNLDIIRTTLEFFNDKLNSDKGIKKILEEYENCGRVLVICNTIKKSVEIYNGIKKYIENYRESRMPQVCLLHSLFTQKDKEEKYRKIMSNESCIWICTQMVEVSLDIDFPIVFSELAPLENLIQRMGRCNRKGQFENSRFYLETKNTSGLDIDNVAKLSVYDREICDRTKSLIEELLTSTKKTTISEQEKVDMLEKLYTDEKIANIIKKAFNDAEKELRDLFGGLPSEVFFKMDPLIDLTNRIEAQKLFRKSLLPVRVIPENIYKQNKSLFDNYNSLKEDRLNMHIEILKLTVPIPIYKLKKLPKSENKPFPIVYALYDDTGLTDKILDNFL